MFIHNNKKQKQSHANNVCGPYLSLYTPVYWGLTVSAQALLRTANANANTDHIMLSGLSIFPDKRERNLSNSVVIFGPFSLSFFYLFTTSMTPPTSNVTNINDQPGRC